MHTTRFLPFLFRLRGLHWGHPSDTVWEDDKGIGLLASMRDEIRYRYEELMGAKC